MNQLENILTQSLSLFIIVPLIAFIVTLLLQNKQEKIIARIVRIAKLFYIGAAVFCFVAWLIIGLNPVSNRLATIYQTKDFVFAIQFYYDEITAVFSIVGSLLFFLVATF